MLKIGIGEQVALGVFFLALITKNKTVAMATGAMLILKFLNLNQAIDFIGENGVNIGIIILTAGCLSPFFQGKVTALELKSAFMSYHGIVGAFAGIAVTLLASRGARCPFPSTILGVIMGTVLGVSLFKGVAVGPMIGSGIALSLIGLLEFFLLK